MPFNSEPCEFRAAESFGEASRIIGLTRVLVGILCFALLLDSGQAFVATPPGLFSVSLTWDPSPSPEVVGYNLYYGAASGNYTNTVAMGSVTTVTVSGLLSGVTYYFAVTAVGADGQESGFSNEVTYQQPLPLAQLQVSSLADGQFTLTVTGPAGQTYDLEATQDFQTWTLIGTVTLDASGSLEFTDTNAANFPQRFYRTRDPQP